MKSNELYEVRCQNSVTVKGHPYVEYSCNTLCGKVTSISMGEFWCRKCKKLFNFLINEDGEVTYYDHIGQT